MQRLTIFAGLLLYATFGRSAEKIFDFSDVKAGEMPPLFRSVVSGEGKPGEWKIVMDELPQAFPSVSGKAPVQTRRPVVAQVARDRTDEHAPILIYEGETFGDFKLTTLFKLVDGAVEQMAGIAFRIQDENNYYYVRASGIGKSFYFYKIVNGQRSPTPIGSKVEISRGVWHELGVECKGIEIRASLDGKELVPTLNDKSFANGRIGYWTKSDSVSYFADTRVIYTPRERLAQVLVKESLRANPRLIGLQMFAVLLDSKDATLVASSNATEIGRPAPPEVRDVLARSTPYQGKDRDHVIITLPMRDRNGENMAAVKVIMKSFPGQTDKNALARAMPIVKAMEQRVQTKKDLLD
jgi:hypothetical protein